MSKQSGARRNSRQPQAERMRERLLKKLPAMLDAAIAAYQRIALMEHTMEDPKATAAAHSGAKAILVHIDQIIKLAEVSIGGSSHDDRASGDLDAILAASRTALSAEQEPENATGAADDVDTRS